MDRLKTADDGRPRLFILRDALVAADPDLQRRNRPTNTADEIPGYIWDSTPGKDPKEGPVKSDDHGCDAMRYLVMATERRTVAKVGSAARRRIG